MNNPQVNAASNSFNSYWGIESISRVVMLLCACLVIIYCVWTLDRGFEITDEAYYLLLAMHADSVKLYISAQQWITAGFWRMTGSLELFRASGMVALLAGSILLALGSFSISLRFGLVADRPGSKAVMLAGSVVGAMLYASTINFSPCYNLLASAGAYAAAGLVLLASNRPNITHKYILLIIAGCALGVEFLCKPSAGIATLVLLVFWVCIFEKLRNDKIAGTVAMIFVSIAFVFGLLLVNTTVNDAMQIFQQSMQLFRMVQVETIGARLIRYANDYWHYLSKSLVTFAIPILAMIAYAKTRRMIFAKVGLVCLVIILIWGKYIFGGFNRYDVQTVSIFAMLVMALIVSFSVWIKNLHTLILFMGLFFLPYSVAIGTGNTLFTQVIDSLASWGVMVAVLVVADESAARNKMPISLIGVCFMVTMSLQIVTSSLRPYNLLSPLIKQNQVITVGNLGAVKVDTGTYKFLIGMRAAVKECGIAPGMPFLGLYNIPGVSLALKTVPLLTPWLNNKEQAEFVIERLSVEEMSQVVVALQMDANEALPPLPRQLAGFPLGYRYCGTATYPYRQQKIQIWQYQAR